MKNIEVDATVVDETVAADASVEPAELITVEQMPIISEQLDRVKAIIDSRAREAMALECTEDNRKEIKAIRAAFNKEKDELDKRYKAVMDEVLAPAVAVQKKYKECTEGYKKADAALKERIDSVERTLKNRKREAVKAYFEELTQAKGIDFMSFDDMGLKIGLSSSEKSLKTEVDNFLSRVACDLNMIRLNEDADEILVEYKQNGFRASDAVNTVMRRKRSVEDERKRRTEAREEEAWREQAAKEAIQAARDYEENESRSHEALQPPEPEPIIPDDDKIIIVNLNLGRYKTTKEKVRKLKKVIFDFIREEGGFEKLDAKVEVFRRDTDGRV